MVLFKYLQVLILGLYACGCTYLYHGDGEYVVDRYMWLGSYSIEFPLVPLDSQGVYVYNFDNYYTGNTTRPLEFDVESDTFAIVPTILSTNVKFEVFDSSGKLVAFMDSPLNRRELSTYRGELTTNYPDMSWFGGCSESKYRDAYELRERIANDLGNANLHAEYISKVQAFKCTYIPDYDTKSAYYDSGDGDKIKSFHRYKVVLTVSEPNPACKDVKGRLVLRSGWK